MYNQSDVTEEEILQVWEDYKSIFKEYYQPRKFTKRRKASIKRMLKDFTREELKKSMLAIADNDYMVGKNKDDRFYAKPNYCFRNYEKTEEWLNKYEEADEKENKTSYKQHKKIEEIEAIYAGNIYNLKSLDYKDYLQTEHWQHFVKECKKFFNNKCQICGKRKRFASTS